MAPSQVMAAVVGAVLLLLSAVSAVAGVLAAEVSSTVIATGAVFAAGTLVTILGWIAVQVYTINATTSATNEMVRGAVSDVTQVGANVHELEVRVRALEAKVGL